MTRGKICYLCNQLAKCPWLENIFHECELTEHKITHTGEKLYKYDNSERVISRMPKNTHKLHSQKTEGSWLENISHVNYSRVPN